MSPTLSLDGINTSAACPIPIPNKHLPICPPGPAPADKPDTPPQSPPSKEISLTPQSLLYPPDNYKPRILGSSTVYEIDAAGVAAAVEHISGQPLPDPAQVFPWFHGLHPANHIQQAFFIARRRNLKKTPKCLRGLTIVKAGGDLSSSRLKGAIAPEEFLLQATPGAAFKEVDPREGFSVRNFQIQAAKFAMLSDIVVYGDDDMEVRKLAMDVAAAQKAWVDSHSKGNELPRYNVFVCMSHFSQFEKYHPEIVTINSRGHMTGRIMDFFHQERIEMCTMTKASEIHHNIWLGPTPDPAIDPALLGSDDQYDILIECSDLGRLNPLALQALAEANETSDRPIHLEFPSSGSIMPPTWSHAETDGILETCKWLYNLSHGIALEASSSAEPDEEGDSPMPYLQSPTSKKSEHKILLHCTDGYTESTLLALSYYTYATGLSVPSAWLDLHMSKKRNFFAYPSDVALLKSIAPRLLSGSPTHRGKSLSEITGIVTEEPEWITQMDGSLPSRVTDYMYLGNLTHANNPDLLRRMGIRQILSVGETATWKDGEEEKWGLENVMTIQRVQDNGVDPLTEEFERCLGFIGM